MQQWVARENIIITRIPPTTDAALPVEYNYDPLAWSALIVYSRVTHTPSLLPRLLLHFSTWKEQYSLTSHTLCREKGVWSCCNYWVVAKERNYRFDVRCWHLLKTWCNCTPWQWMQSTKSMDLIGQIKFLPWWQLNDCSLPFCEGCGLRDYRGEATHTLIWRKLANDLTLRTSNHTEPYWILDTQDCCKYSI